MTGKMKLYLIEPIDEEAKERLTEITDITDHLEDADIVLSRNLRINKEFLDKAKKLKCIAIHGTGTSECDIPYAKSKGITVFNAPYQNVESVAEMNLALALMALRHLDKRSMDGGLYFGRDLKSLSVGIIGLGHIGRRTYELFSPIVKDIFVYDRKNKDIKITPLDTVLEKSDIIILSLALCDETRHLINKEKLSLMKKNIILINTARGALMDEGDLYAFLKESKDAIYASDVFEHEPLSLDNPLLGLENVIAYPHIASSTGDSLHNLGVSCLLGIKAFIEHKEIKNKL